MKKTYFIHKDRIVDLLDNLGTEFVCIAPVKDETGSSFYKEWTGGEVNLSANTDISLKEFLNPEIQRILSFEKLDGGIKLTPRREQSFTPTAVFGLRPCDTAAVSHLRRFAETEPQDREMVEKRESLAIITVACDETCPSGFCTSMGTGPVGSGGFDIQLIPFKEGFIVEGEWKPLLERLDLFEQIEADVEERKNEIIEGVRRVQQRYDMDRVERSAGKGIYSERLTMEFARRCQKCSGCVFICPTCTCFNIVDRVLGDDKGERLKVWDSCFLDGFTAMAGGGNSVKGPDGHLDRRLKCKFSGVKFGYAAAGKWGSCVGCGRCDQVCPGNIGMSRMLELG